MDPSILLPPPRNVPVAVQVLWVTQKNFKLKMGAMGGFILEMLLPALLATALVPAWLAADRSRRPEREFSSMPVMDVPAIMEPYKCVADGVSITSPLTGLLYCACNTTATLPCIGVMCLDTTGDALTLYEIATTYEGPVVPPDLDIMILVQQAGKHGLIGDGSSMGHTSYTASFTVGTKIAIFSEIGGNDHLVELMKTYYRNRSVLFDEVFMSFESEGQLTDYTYDEGNAQMMGAIVVNGPYDYAIRVNRSATANTKMDQEWGDPSGLGKSYKKYITGGFITLQQMTNNFWLHYGSQGAHVALNDLVILPCYIPSYREDEFLVAAGRFLPLVAAISYLYFIGQYVSSMVKEKEDRIKEGMLVMGLSPAAFKLSWYLLGFFEGFVISLTLSIVYCASYFGNSSFFLLFMLLFLFSTSIVAGANLVACFFSKAQIAGLAAPFIFLATVIPRFATSNPDSLFMLNVLSAFPFSGGMTTISDLEKSGRGLSSDSLGDGEDPVKKAYMLLVMDTILYIVLEWYFSKVLPSEWGTHRHPCFCCPCVSSTPAEIDVKKVTCNRVEEVTDPDVLKREVVSIDNLTKCFSSETGVFTAVNTLSLKMYEGQALVLLGHNGAGKTTTINMLTGMLPVTSGDATVFGKSIVWNLSAIRKDIGLCPQHNILWPNLTCREHLMFFGRIRGLKDAELVNDVTKMLRDIDLEERADYRTCGLSGGMMRKLSVGIALIGGPRLIILDEPTAGMDIQARRAIWDLIKKNKKGRTMLLTTHFMDEADLLGDSIAIMSDGRLYSWGSGLYLKSSLGVGYNLRCEMNSKCVPSAVEAVLQNEVDQVNTDEKGCNKVGIVSQAGRELVLRLPMYAVSAFPKILRHLETGGDELGVDRFGISVTTLEEIFIKIAQNGNLVPNEEENTNKDLDFDISDVEKVTGSSLVVLQMKACFRKRLNCGKRDKRTLCYQLFLPVMLIALALGLSMIPIPSYPSKDLTPGHVTEAVLNPEQYGQDYVRNDRYVALSVGSTASWRGTEEVLRDTFYSHEKNRMCATVLNTTTSRYPYTYKPPAPCRELGNTTLQKSERRKSFLSNTVGVMQKLLVPSINDTHAAFFNGSFLHSLPQAVLVHHTALLRAVTGDNSLTINTVNSPFPNSKSLQARFESFATVILGLFVLIPFAIVPSTYVSFLVKERQCKAKHIQLASGVGLFAFWASTFIWDLCSYMVTTGAAFAMFGAFSRDEYIGNAENAMATLVLFFFYGLSSIGAAYVASFYFRTHTQAQSVVSGFSLFAGFVLVITTNILESIDSTKDVSRVLRHMFRVVPSFCVGDGIIAIAGIPIKTSYGMDPPGPFDMDVIGWDVLWMAIEAPIFYFITLAHDYPEILYILGIRKYAGEEASQDDEEVEEVWLGGFIQDTVGQRRSDRETHCGSCRPRYSVRGVHYYCKQTDEGVPFLRVYF